MIKDDVIIIGLGACGSNIALGFQNKNYPALFINGSRQDNKALKGAVENCIFTLDGFDGCGGDRDKAELALANNIVIAERLQKIKQKIIILIFATGGSTGSGLAPVVADLLLEERNKYGEPEKTVCCIPVLPRKNEAYQKHINAYQCAKELQEIEDLGACLFVDNGRIEDPFIINAKLIALMDSFLADESYSKKGNVDGAERRKMLRQHGSFIVYDDFTNIVKSMQGLITGLTNDNIFAPLQNDKIVEHIAIINSHYEVDEDILCKTVGIPQNVFKGYGRSSILVAMGGLSFPIDHIKNLGKLAEREYTERMSNRKETGMLGELSFGESKVAREEKKKKPSRLEQLRQLNGSK